MRKDGAAVFVHALRPAGMERIVGAFSEQAVCFPNESALACASMITGGIGARHPKLRIAFSHGGGTMPILLPRLVHAWNMVQKTKESLPESPAVTAKRFFYDNVLFDPSSVKFLVERFGASQVLVGSDYPFALGEKDPLGMLDKAGLDLQTKNLITSTNAKRFLGLPEAPR
jgi:aminocarboxymuconate-semialdehyde decarboxylase